MLPVLPNLALDAGLYNAGMFAYEEVSFFILMTSAYLINFVTLYTVN